MFLIYSDLSSYIIISDFFEAGRIVPGGEKLTNMENAGFC
jgi:hypothetical protein